MSRSDPMPGARYGRWLVLERIGHGANGVVWKVQGEGAESGALKLLRARHMRNAARKSRFADEIKAMLACADIPGVLPLLDWHVSSDSRRADAMWLVSAHALSLERSAPKNLEQAVKLCLSLAGTMATMHSRGYSHRDIKPENIFLHRGVWCLGDFGLADFPEKSTVTVQGEKLGPIHYIAPEMLNDAQDADGAKADVYSLGKLLWKVATGQTYPLPGTHDRHIPALTIGANVGDKNAVTLDALLEAMTLFDPAARPSMADVVKALQAWLAPPPTQKYAADLAVYEKRIGNLTVSYRQDQERRRFIQERADSERSRVFDAFAPTLKLIVGEFQRAGIHRIDAMLPSGGNGHFYELASGGRAVGRIWMYQFAYTARLDGGKKRAALMSGVNLGIRNVESDPDPLHDIYAPVLSAAGHIVCTDVLANQKWVNASRLVWGETGEFHFGQPTEAAEIRRLTNGLVTNLVRAVEEFIGSFEALRPIE